MVKNSLQCGRPGFDPWVGKVPWRRAWQPTPIFNKDKQKIQNFYAHARYCDDYFWQFGWTPGAQIFDQILFGVFCKDVFDENSI